MRRAVVTQKVWNPLVELSSRTRPERSGPNTFPIASYGLAYIVEKALDSTADF